MTALPRLDAPLSACPACVAAPAAIATADRASGVMLSVPAVHCAACISVIEGGLAQVPGVRSARVNLTQRRVSVNADPSVTPEALEAALARLGYEAHALDAGLLSVTETDRKGRDLLMRMGVAGFASMNVMLLSVAVWSGADAATRDMFHWISAAIALPTVIFSAQPFFRSAWAALRVGRLNMDVPISLAILMAAGISLSETILSGPRAYFDAAVSLTFLLLVGRYLDHRTRAVARSAAGELAALEVPRVSLLRDGVEVVVPLSEVSAGDLVRVRPGGRMPVDGVVTNGESEIDRSLLNGESLPVFAGPGQAVSAGETNLTGPLTLRVTAAGRDSSLHRMADLVSVAEQGRMRYISLADRAARAYAPGVHLLAFAAFCGWWWYSGGDIRLAFNIAAAVLIITCPCALGLAVPAVLTAASGKLFRKGLLIKDGTALERLAEVDTVVFDKTGTLTLGVPEPIAIAAQPPQVLSVTAALVGASSHPLARGIAAALDGKVHAAAVEDLREVPGYGVEGRWQGRVVRLGRAEWVGVDALPTTATYLSLGDGVTHAFPFADRPRPGAEQALAELRRQGKVIWLVSGDKETSVAALAQRLGIENWGASALPGEKAERVAKLTAEGHRVLMVGDGLNDTAALAAAHVSISPASALDAARAASDIVLIGQDMASIGDAARIAQQTRRRILENFAISLAYNVVAVPLALMGVVTPLIAAVAMSVSSITVSLNALRLR
ncbi:MAG: cadmium-translocating P-type ATPase [Cereibacter sphaeroides]|uniref:Cadmium-translocating P-type ATPase n=1 Tax=Cereibacter sphaeroides TaxID=1063 RepID=A0A2W5SCU6_CERSP|nr:MAG: cadmium-translocating P-type ATPase [Cereibacter sphaeroides]